MPRVSHNDEAPKAPVKPKIGNVQVGAEKRKPERFKQHLMCDLTDAELLDRAIKMSENMRTVEGIKLEASERATTYKKEIGGLEVKVSALRKQVLDRKESRYVECERQYNYQQGLVEVFRLDTGEEHSSRAMTGDERQLKVPGS